MKLLKLSSFSLAVVLAATSSASIADSRNAPPGPPPGDDYADSYGYSEAGSTSMRMERPYASYREDVTSPAPYGTDYSYGSDRHSRHPHPRDEHQAMMGYDYGVVDDTVMYQGHWVGSMTGSWNGGPVRTWQGSFDSSNGQPHWHGQYVDHPMGYAPQSEFHAQSYPHQGYARQGYGYGYGARYIEPAYEEVTVPGQPIVTKTVRTYVSYVDVPVRTHYVYKRVWHAAYHPVCSCAAPRPAPKPRVRYHPHVIQGS
jgi:hypothetical protein